MSTFWQEVLARPREIFGKLSRGQKIGVLALCSVGVVVATLASLLAGRESYAMLYGGLEPEAANEIVSQLSSSGVPYRVSPDGTSIQVPEQRVAEIKMQLAGAGLPKSGTHGFEIFDQTQLGFTDGLFNVNMQRAVQGELERIIETLNGVRKASVLVHLQAPSLFSKERSRSTAAVKLSLRPGTSMPAVKTAAIAFLVASSVGNGMEPTDVSIIDSEMHLLYPQGDSKDPAAAMDYLLKQQAIEKQKQEAAESQLERTIGPGRASVRVSVDLNMTHKETQTEKVGKDNSVTVRESQTIEGGTPPTKSDPGNIASAKSKPEPGDPGRSETETENRAGVERQLLIDGGGSISHMSVSLLLDEGWDKAKDNADKLGEIVKNAVGFSKTRKDEFTVLTIPFEKAPAPPPVPGPFALENLLPLAGHLTEAATVLFVLFLLTRTLRGGGGKGKAKPKVLVPGAPAGAVAAMSGGTEEENEFAELTYAAEGKSGDLRARLNRFVTMHPDQAREVLMAWLKEEMLN